MSGPLQLLPMIVGLLLWAHWFQEGESGPVWKLCVLGLLAAGIGMHHFSSHVIPGLVLEVLVAIGLLFWNRWNDARHG